MGLTLLHLSDIHFKSFDGKDFIDVNLEIQNELRLDLIDLKPVYKNIDLMLIGGDIAFSGDKLEYDRADAWIEQICQVSGCRQELVLTVPGNHDVERNKITPLLRETQRSLKALRDNRDEIDSRFEKYLTSSDIQFLTSPFENYNQFAQKFGSVPQKGNLLFWEQKFNLDGLTLKIRGVNSALVSNNEDHEVDSQLVLGSHQSKMQREEGVVNLILCHHPPSWLCDGDHAHSDFKNKIRLHLFGHKHEFDIDLIDDKCLVLSAGAMMPDRRESGWEPTYNIIHLSVERNESGSFLCVTVSKRVWDKSIQKFGPTLSNFDDCKKYKLLLDKIERIIIPSKSDDDTMENIAKNSAVMREEIVDVNGPNHFRKLAYMFLKLPYDLRVEIAVKLNLVDESDAGFNDFLKAQNYLQRAVEKNLLSQLWDIVNENDNDNKKSENPFNNLDI